MEPAPILEADRLSKSFGGRPVLVEASFAAKPTCVTALMGRNGSGKSTMLEIAVGRVAADRGRVFFDDEWLDRPVLASMAREGLYYSAQDSALTDLFTVGDQLRTMADVFGKAARLDHAIDLLQLEELLGRRPGALSGGERKRCALAMAMVRQPSCLLMDEPFAGTAPGDRALIVSALEELRREARCATVITGHDVDDVLSLADEIVWIADGKTHDLGSPEEARGHHRFRREYLGTDR